MGANLIGGHLIKIAGRQEELTTSSWFQWLGFDVQVASRADGLWVKRKGRSSGAPIIRLNITPEYLLSLIGKGRYHKVDGKVVHGSELRQSGEGTVDLVGGIDAQRDGPDQHELQSVAFSYFESDDRFGMLFDIVFGDGIPGKGCNGWSVHADVTGQRVWIRCDPFWSELFDLHEWAKQPADIERLREMVREALGFEIDRQPTNANNA